MSHFTLREQVTYDMRNFQKQKMEETVWKGAVHFGRSRAADSGQRVRRGRGSDDPGAV